MDEQTLFTEALEIEDAAGRAAFLARACAGDPALRRRVERLLAYHEQAGDFLEGPPPGATGPAPAGRPDLAFLAPPRRPGSLGRLDHYDVMEVLGNGSMGVVLKAFDEKLRRVVAIKVLAPYLTASATARKRFIREAQAAAAVRDEHVVAIHAVSDDGPLPYLVMEYIQGQTLDQRLQRGGPVELAEVLRIGLQAARGLAAAHAQGLVHRDVKPGNILLENGVQRVKLTDFGLARAADDASLTREGDLAGTPLYMSPEQAAGEPVDHRSDLFSLGSVLYVLFTGRPPFEGDSSVAVLKRVREDAPPPLRAGNVDAPAWLQAIVARLHARAPDRRFQSAAEVADLLAGHLAHLQQPHRVPPPGNDLPPPRRSRRLLLPAAAALLVALGAWGAYGLLRPGGGGTGAARPGAPAGAPGTRTVEELAARPSPLDGRRAEDLPAAFRALAGGGDPNRAPRELVAVLGDPRFLVPTPPQGDGKAGWMAQSPDGRVLAVPADGDVVLFDTTTGLSLRSLSGGAGRVWRAAFSPDGKHVAAAFRGSDTGPVRVWEVASGRMVRDLPGHTAWAHGVAFSPDGTRLASSGDDRTVRVCDWRTGKEVFSHPLAGEGRGVAFSPDGKFLAVGSSGEDNLVVLDAHTGHLLHTLRRDRGWTYTVAFNRRGQLLATGPGGLEVWEAPDFTNGRTVADVPHEWAAFTPDGRTLFSAPTDHRKGTPYAVSRWDVATGRRKGRVTLNIAGGYAGYLLGADGKTVFAVRTDRADGRAHPYDPLTGRSPWPIRGHEGPVHAVAVSPDGRLLATGGADRTARLWDLATLREVHTLRRHAQAVGSVAFSPDGRLLASGSLDTTVVLWGVATGAEVRTLVGHSREPSRVAFSPDGRKLAAGRESGAVRVWDVATGKREEDFRPHESAVGAVAYSPDGKFLASAARDGTVAVCEAASGRRVRTFTSPGAGWTSLAFAPDGKRLVAGSAARGAVCLWDLGSGEEQELSAGGPVGDLAVDRAGRLAAACGGAVRVWPPTPAGTPAFTLGPGPFGPALNGVAFAPGGRYLATANENGTVAILRLAPGPAH